MSEIENYGSQTSDAPKLEVCSNCKKPYQSEDKYCRFCGAPMGKPDYIDDDFAEIYGPPPMKRKHICKKCGFNWTTIQMVDKERYCPKCGGNAPVSCESDIFWS